MTQISTCDRIAALLREAGAAHHRAFAATNGDDPAWPRWYAEFLVTPLGELVGRSLAVDVLAMDLASLDTAHRATAARSDWPTYYAERLFAHYGSAAAPPSGRTEGERG